MTERIINLNKDMMSHLSFPDFEVNQMEISQQEKKLQIFIGGGWLDIEGGTKLGNGILYFDKWETLSVSRFDPITESWSPVEGFTMEPLRDIGEIKILDSTVSLSGFGKELGQWMEWKIINTQMRAEFKSQH